MTKKLTTEQLLHIRSRVDMLRSIKDKLHWMGSFSMYPQPAGYWVSVIKQFEFLLDLVDEADKAYSDYLDFCDFYPQDPLSFANWYETLVD